MITIDDIVKVVCGVTKITEADIYQPDKEPGARKMQKSFARQVCWERCWHYKLGSDVTLGRHFNRNHATLTLARQRLFNDIAIKGWRKDVYDNICEKIAIDVRLSEHNESEGNFGYYGYPGEEISETNLKYQRQ